MHERDINTDFLLLLLRDVSARRPDLRLVLMSATLDASSFAAYFGGAPLVEVVATVVTETVQAVHNGTVLFLND